MTAHEPGLRWVKAQASTAGNDCVEAAASRDGTTILVRDSKDREGPVLRFSRSEWKAFRTGVGDGDFDFPE